MSTANGKSCPRCGNAMVNGEDHYGDYKSCIGCGFVLEANGLTLKQAEEETAHRKVRRMSSHQVRL